MNSFRWFPGDLHMSIYLGTGWYVFDKKETSAVLFVITEWEWIDALLWISPQNNKK